MFLREKSDVHQNNLEGLGDVAIAALLELLLERDLQ